MTAATDETLLYNDSNGWRQMKEDEDGDASQLRPEDKIDKVNLDKTILYGMSCELQYLSDKCIHESLNTVYEWYERPISDKSE